MIKVKALEWEEFGDGSNYFMARNCSINLFNGRYCAIYDHLRVGDGFDTLDDAKAACQAHHTQHVLSMIEGNHE